MPESLTSRRSFLSGLIAAPAVIRVAPLMRVSALALPKHPIIYNGHQLGFIKPMTATEILLERARQQYAISAYYSSLIDFENKCNALFAKGEQW